MDRGLWIGACWGRPVGASLRVVCRGQSVRFAVRPSWWRWPGLAAGDDLMDEANRRPLAIALTVVVGLFAIYAVFIFQPGGAEPRPTSVADRSDPTPSATPTPTTTATPIPTSTPSPTPSATSSPTPTEDAELQALRDSNAWVNLAEWDRALTGRRLFTWTNTEGTVAEFSNTEDLWNQFAPVLRERLLQQVIAGEIEPETVRFRGLPIQDEAVSGLLRWFTNAGTGGRGLMFVAVASYQTAEGEPHYRGWPVLIDPGPDPDVSTEGRLVGIGEPFDSAVSDLPTTITEIDLVMGASFRPWLDSQPVLYDPVNPACPDSGCGR